MMNDDKKISTNSAPLDEKSNGAGSVASKLSSLFSKKNTNSQVSEPQNLDKIVNNSKVEKTAVLNTISSENKDKDIEKKQSELTTDEKNFLKLQTPEKIVPEAKAPEKIISAMKTPEKIMTEAKAPEKIIPAIKTPEKIITEAK